MGYLTLKVICKSLHCLAGKHTEKKASTNTDKVVSEDNLDMEDRQTTECSQEISEYSKADGDESADIDDSDDELVECFEECTLQGDGEGQST